MQHSMYFDCQNADFYTINQLAINNSSGEIGVSSNPTLVHINHHFLRGKKAEAQKWYWLLLKATKGHFLVDLLCWGILPPIHKQKAGISLRFIWRKVGGSKVFSVVLACSWMILPLERGLTELPQCVSSFPELIYGIMVWEASYWVIRKRHW